MTSIDIPAIPACTTRKDPILIAVWWDQNAAWWPEKAWWWDEPEDHGGYDRCSPNGPFYNVVDALGDAQNVFGPDATVAISSFERPDHYSKKLED